MASQKCIAPPKYVSIAAVAVVGPLVILAIIKLRRSFGVQTRSDDGTNEKQIMEGGYESLIGNTPLVYLPHLSSLLNNNVRIYVKMENMNPGGTGKDRAAMSMILAAEKKGELPPPLKNGKNDTSSICHLLGNKLNTTSRKDTDCNNNNPTSIHNSFAIVPPNIHAAILTAVNNSKTHGIIIEGTSGSTGIALASISSSRGHGVIVVMPDDQSSQKREFLERLGCGVVVVKNCSISNPGHYVNVAKRIWEWIEGERRYDEYLWISLQCNCEERNGRTATKSDIPKLIKAAFMNQFENLANLHSHYTTTGPEIFHQLHGEVDAFVMSAGTGGTIVGVGGYLKDNYWYKQHASSTGNHRAPPRVVLVDPPGSSLYNKVKFGVAFAPQQSEQKLRRHRYDTLAEGIGLDRITANFGLGCEDMSWSDNGCTFQRKIHALLNEVTEISNNHSGASESQSKIVDDAISISDQQAVCMAHYLLRHEGMFVGSSTAMNLAGALIVASSMPVGSNVVTVICDGGQRHTQRFWNRSFVEKWGLVWPGAIEGDDGIVDSRKNKDIDILQILGIA